MKKLISGYVTSLMALMLVFSISACIKNNVTTTGEITLSNTDYSDPNNWLSFGGGGKDVDIFAIYPTLRTSDDAADIPFVRLDSPEMRAAAEAWLQDMDDIISAHANVYAPLYRQINLATISRPGAADSFDNEVNGIPREDIFAAFAYYLTEINRNERPFILIGHSQGSHMVRELATTFLGDDRYEQYNRNLVIAYAIGISITQEQMDKNPQLGFSQTENDTGVIASWNTTSSSEVETESYLNFGTWYNGALMTNPITWKTNETPAAPVHFVKTYHNPFGVYVSVEGYADARVDNTRGLLIVSTLDEADYPAPPNVPLSRYHGFDVWFFADSITENIKDRINSFKR